MVERDNDVSVVPLMEQLTQTCVSSPINDTGHVTTDSLRINLKVEFIEF